MDKKITIQIKNRLTGAVLFEYTKENNTIKDTLLEALRQDADLHKADLRNADLCNADIRNAILWGAYLSGANLYGADLRGAVLGNADLSFVNLCSADLRFVNLCSANLRGANIHGADLRNAYLRDAFLRDADLRDADLGDAYLYGANLYVADLRGAKNIPYIPLACPANGEFIGWKKVKDKWLVKLRIPEDAKRSSATTQKCRCDKAEVLAITDIEGNNPIEEIINASYAVTTYKVGEMVYPDAFDDDRWNECSHGIHFFIYKQDAIDY